jgi:L-alanine-DL-glutamate epimerase-like enolase superfamily enzyme
MNVLVIVVINGIAGYGEIGLPPKKPHCYVADINDITTYYTQLFAEIKAQKEIPEAYIIDQNIEIQSLMICQHKAEYHAIRKLFYCIDNCVYNKYDYSRPAKSGIECALFDLISCTCKMPLYKLLGGNATDKKIGFYTAAMHESIDETISSATLGLKYTSAIKIKASADIKSAIATLKLLCKSCGMSKANKNVISIDANAAWTPKNALEFFDQISVPENKDIKDMIYMIEQPFPVEIANIEKEWEAVKNKYNGIGILVYADESVSTSSDVHQLAPFCNGVNIKLEKAGGIREALNIIRKCKLNGMLIWIGMMVGSILNTNTGAHLLSYTKLGGDLDGTLLVTEESQLFSGGFIWETHGEEPKSYIQMTESYGVGVTPKYCLIPK